MKIMIFSSLKAIIVSNFTHASLYIHLSNVLTNHCSNSLSEKTTNDSPMNFLQCHFKTTYYRLPLSNRGIYLKIIHVRRNSIFMFYRTCIAYINTITFQVGYFTRQ